MRGDRPLLPPMSTAIYQFTPHARGSTLGPHTARKPDLVYPACAGIDLSPASHLYASICLPRMRGNDPRVDVSRFGRLCLPRMRGDRPHVDALKDGGAWFTPHARGSTYAVWIGGNYFVVYPACAGIDPYAPLDCRGDQSLPRMRGDRPSGRTPRHPGGRFTPHARGSTGERSMKMKIVQVYPACAGIDLHSSSSLIQKLGLPRMRGDRPFIAAVVDSMGMFTPHARGSTSKPQAHE